MKIHRPKNKQDDPFNLSDSNIITQNPWEYSEKGLLIPLKLCIDYLTQYGLETDGLFRIPGNVNEVEALSNMFERKQANMQLLINSNPNNVASYFKVRKKKI